MPCCHADFAAVEGSDRGFTVGMPTFTFGAGVLAEAGDNARELGLRRVGLFTDARMREERVRRDGAGVARRRARRLSPSTTTLRSSRPMPRSRTPPASRPKDVSTATCRSAAAR